jgi:DNA-binding IscR family transcriptional regulator
VVWLCKGSLRQFNPIHFCQRPVAQISLLSTVRSSSVNLIRSYCRSRQSQSCNINHKQYCTLPTTAATTNNAIANTTNTTKIYNIITSTANSTTNTITTITTPLTPPL